MSEIVDAASVPGDLPAGAVNVVHCQGRWGEPLIAVVFPRPDREVRRARAGAERRMRRWLDQRRPITARHLDALAAMGRGRP